MKINSFETSLPKKVNCDGTSIWDDTNNLTVEIKKIQRTDYHLLVFTDTKKMLYTDKGFEREVNKILKDENFLMSAGWSEQGLQNPDKKISHFDLYVG